MARLTLICIVILLYLTQFRVEGGGLSYNFYKNSCPRLEYIIKASLTAIFVTDPTSPAAFLRLMFHDCQVQGCDASILLDMGEMGSRKNYGIRRREMIGIVKSVVEAECPNRVSCADILILAAREAVAVSGGPRISVPLGRRDSIAAPSSKVADASLPSATAGLSAMLPMFTRLGMSVEESVAIMGAHTLGVTHCSNILDRLNESKVKGTEPGFESFLRLRCSRRNSSIVLNDPTTLTFDNKYYSNVMRGRGLMPIDAELAVHPQTAPFVKHFIADQNYFFRMFSSAFVKLSSSGVLVGNHGVIRKRCNAV